MLCCFRLLGRELQSVQSLHLPNVRSDRGATRLLADLVPWAATRTASTARTPAHATATECARRILTRNAPAAGCVRTRSICCCAVVQLAALHSFCSIVLACRCRAALGLVSLFCACAARLLICVPRVLWSLFAELCWLLLRFVRSELLPGASSSVAASVLFCWLIPCC